MEVDKLQKANRLQVGIKRIEQCIDSGSIKWFGGIYWSTISKRFKYILLPEELNEEIKEVLKRNLDKYKKELEEL